MQIIRSMNKKELIVGLYLGALLGLALTILIAVLGINEVWMLVALTAALVLPLSLKFLLKGLLFIVVKGIKICCKMVKRIWNCAEKYWNV